MTDDLAYVRLIELAECSPDSPSINAGRDKRAQAEWLAARLAARGHTVSTDEIERAADEWWAAMHRASSRARTIRL